MNDLADVYSEWENNPLFREAFKNDPVSALEQWGYKLSKDDLQKMLDFKNNNENLDDRINK